MKDKFFVLGFVFILLIAGYISLYASSDPDGLERVAEDMGFLEAGEGHEVIESPMPDYMLPGIEDETLSASAAGVVGTVIVACLVLSVAYFLRKPNAKSADK